MTCKRGALALSLLWIALAAVAPGARAEGLADDGGASWRVEQPPPPPPEGTQESLPSNVPIGLGQISDIEFWAPNRGLLITGGNGSTIPPGLWTYDGAEWHELSTVCGSRAGRIAWAGPDEFWTISDGRPGQAPNPVNGQPAPLEALALCHFSGGQVVGSYASLAFRADSYQPMDGAACLSPSDCWFVGAPLPEPQVGAFQLHWNGASLTPQPNPNPQGHAVHDLRAFGGRLYESLRLTPEDRVPVEEPQPPPVLDRINPTGIAPTFASLLHAAIGVPLYRPPEPPAYDAPEFPSALDFLHLGSDEDALWGAASAAPTPEHSAPGEVTVVRDSAIRCTAEPEQCKREATPSWSQVVGPGAEPPGGNPLQGDVVNAIAAEPGTNSAWVALSPPGEDASSPRASAVVARISAAGALSDVQHLPSHGSAQEIACPAIHDCWMATRQGWLLHLSNGERPAPANDPAFSSLITYRPPDSGIPQVPPDAPPPDTSGLVEEPPSLGAPLTESPPVQERVRVALLSHMRSRVRRGDVLELRFHLAVKARVRLVALRGRKAVAHTARRTFPAGNRKLLLRLTPKRWPTKLSLQTHALAPLPTTSATGGAEGGAGPTTIGTSLAFPRLPAFRGPLG